MTRPDLATVPEPEPGIRLLGAEWGTGTFWNDLRVIVIGALCTYFWNNNYNKLQILFLLLSLMGCLIIDPFQVQSMIDIGSYSSIDFVNLSVPKNSVNHSDWGLIMTVRFGDYIDELIYIPKHLNFHTFYRWIVHPKSRSTNVMLECDKEDI